jgi:alpha-L-rhamnosidase
MKFFPAILSLAASAAMLPAGVVKDLRCEDLVSPLGVDRAQPKLSWRMEDRRANGEPVNDQRQTAYRILVASTPKQLAANEGDLWDSNKVVSDQSLHVAYAGKPLASRTRCFWKVSVWDKDGKSSGWSEPAEWTMGLLKPEDWQAKWIAHSAVPFEAAQWIWHPGEKAASAASPTTRHFRRTLTLPAHRKLSSARARITADNAFVFAINGTEITGGNDWMHPVEADVTRALRPGDNIISVRATNTEPGAAGLVARFELSFSSGPPLALVTDAEWESSADGACWAKAEVLGDYGAKPWGTFHAAAFPHPWMRRNFELQSAPERALVFVNTPGHFELYLNGKKVGDDVLAPAYSDYTKRMFVVAYDVTSLLQKGANCIALWAAPGWYQPPPRYTNPYGSPVIRAQLDIWGDGGLATIGTDATWRTKESCITQVGTWSWANMGGENWDDSKYLPGWNLVSHDDSSWSVAREITPPDVVHQWLAMPGNRLLEPVKPVKVSRLNGRWVIDFGTTLTGWMKLRMKNLKPGQKITVDYADLIGPPELMHIKDKNGFQSFGQRDTFVAGDTPEREYCKRFNQSAFRYAVVDGLPDAPALDDATALPVMTALEPAGSFECSNALFNKIHEITVNTFRSQIPAGVLGGGETREKEGYGDAGAFLTGLLYNFRSDTFFRKWLTDWTDSQRADGFIAHTAPRHVDHGGGPPWGGQASELTRRLLLYYGDAAPIPAVYDNLRRYVDFIESKTRGDILRYYCPYGKNGPWFLGDWVTPTPSENQHGFPEDSMDEKEFFNNCYRVILWDQLANFAARLGKGSEAERCRARLAAIRPLIHETWFDRAKQTYRCQRQAYLSVALQARIMPDELRPVVLERLEEAIAAKNGHLDTGMLGTSMMLDLLARENRNDLVATMMAKTTYPSWGFLAEKRKVTTWPETWTGWGSQIILVTGSPGAWFYEGLAGIRPEPSEPGFKHVVIQPAVVGDVTWVKAHYDSPYGRIASHWEKRAETFKLDAQIPPNCTATVVLPDGSSRRTGSGRYRWTVPLASFAKRQSE